MRLSYWYYTSILMLYIEIAHLDGWHNWSFHGNRGSENVHNAKSMDLLDCFRCDAGKNIIVYLIQI